MSTTLSTVVACRSAVPYGTLFSAATALLSRRPNTAVAGEFQHTEDGVSIAMTPIGVNRGLYGDVVEVNGNGTPMEDREAAVGDLPVLEGCYAAVLLLSVTDDPAPGRHEDLHAFTVVRIVEALEVGGVTDVAWSTDHAAGRQFDPWRFSLDELDVLGDPFAWREAVR